MFEGLLKGVCVHTSPSPFIIYIILFLRIIPEYFFVCKATRRSLNFIKYPKSPKLDGFEKRIRLRTSQTSRGCASIVGQTVNMAQYFGKRHCPPTPCADAATWHPVSRSRTKRSEPCWGFRETPRQSGIFLCTDDVRKRIKSRLGRRVYTLFDPLLMSFFWLSAESPWQMLGPSFSPPFLFSSVLVFILRPCPPLQAFVDHFFFRPSGS